MISDAFSLLTFFIFYFTDCVAALFKRI